MPESQLEQGVEVLTLAEAAAFLRVPEESLRALAVKNAVPAQEIAGEWRFLKRALADWLRFGRLYREFRDFSPWVFGFPPMEELLALIEQRISTCPASAEKGDKPGSKEAVLKHFGVFRDDDDMEARLQDARAQRDAAG
jgi:hypothetical protein